MYISETVHYESNADSKYELYCTLRRFDSLNTKTDKQTVAC